MDPQVLSEKRRLTKSISRSWIENGKLFLILKESLKDKFLEILYGQDSEMFTAESIIGLVDQIFAEIAINLSMLLQQLPDDSAELKVVRTDTHYTVFAGDKIVATSEDFSASISRSTTLDPEGSREAVCAAIQELYHTKVYPDLKVHQEKGCLFISLEQFDLDPTTFFTD